MNKEADEGFVEIVARADNRAILGLQAVGREVSEQSAGFALGLEMSARLEDVVGMIHARPTQSEAFHETAVKALGKPLHV